MRLRRRFAAVTVALTLALGSLGLSATAEAHPRWPKPKDVQLQVLSFNDFHGHLQPPGASDATLGTALDPTNTPVGGAEYLASTLERLRARAKYSQTVTAGDLIGIYETLAGTRLDAAVTALQDTRVLRIERAALFELLADHTDLLQGLFSILLRSAGKATSNTVSTP